MGCAWTYFTATINKKFTPLKILVGILLALFAAAPALAKQQFILNYVDFPAAVSGGGSSVTVLQSTGAQTGFGSSLPIQLPNNATAGSEMELMAMSSASGGQPLNTPTGWTLLASTGNSTTDGMWLYLWRVANSGVGIASATITTQSSNNAQITAFMHEYGGGSFTQSNGATTGKGTGTSATASVTTSIGNCIVVAAMMNDRGTTTQPISAANSFTLRRSITNSATFLTGGSEDFGTPSLLASGNYTPTFTLGNSANWWVVAAGVCQ